MLYELENAHVMSSPGYLERLKNPTPWTKRIMPTLALFRCGGGSIVAQGGNPAGHGGHIAIARFENALPDRLNGNEHRERVNTLAQIDWIANVQFMSVKNDATFIATQEKSIRKSSEETFAGLLVVESLDPGSLDRGIVRASELGEIKSDVFDLYDLVFFCHARLVYGVVFRDIADLSLLLKGANGYCAVSKQQADASMHRPRGATLTAL